MCVNERVYIHVPAGWAVNRVPHRVELCPGPIRQADIRSPGRNQGEQEISAEPLPSLIPGKKRILVPTDFSPSSAQAVKHAANLANQGAVSVTLLHIINVNPPDSAAWAGPAQTLMERLWTEGFAQMDRLARFLAGKQLELRTIVEEGLPWEQIVERSLGFDLIVLGKDPARRWKFFSQHTVQRVTKEAGCPVVVVSGRRTNHWEGTECCI
jgi:nucleotide-binding universal stress UspA family protein